MVAIFVVLIAGFVTIVDLLLKAFVPALSDALGVFIPLIVVNCIIIGRAEAFAAKSSVAASAVDGIAQGLGYTLVLSAMCIVREFLGSGSFGGGLLNGANSFLTMDGSGAGFQIFNGETYGCLFMILPLGGFLTSSPSFWAAARSWACPRRWIPPSAWAWRSRSSWA